MPLVMQSLAEIQSEQIRWLWPGRLARGKLAVLDGDPGVGKSLLTIDLAARLSRGAPLPDGSVAGLCEAGPGSQTPATGRPHTTLLLSAEDDAADTTRPRAEAAGADLDRLVIVTARNGLLPRLPNQLNELKESIAARSADLVVLDPLTAFLTAGVAVNSEQSIRRVLHRLARVAEDTDSAILLVRHLRKQGGRKVLYRGLGSIGIGARARIDLLAGRHPADPGLGVLAVPKGNLTGPVPALGYRVTADADGRAVVAWAGPVEVAADALGESPPSPLRPRDRAVEWLRAKLANGPRKAADIAAAATAAGIPEATLKRAKAELRVDSHRVQNWDGGEWWWSDPDAPWPKDAPFKKPFRLDPLPPLGEL